MVVDNKINLSKDRYENDSRLENMVEKENLVLTKPIFCYLFIVKHNILHS